jgi:methylated-DNA-[protein]-cysteine S-methyltransferase
MADLRGGQVTISTKLGPIGLTFSSRGITGVTFGRPAPTPQKIPAFVRTATRQFQQFAAGKPVRFTTQLDLSTGTTFQQAVWRTLRKIPHGETRTYAWVAKQIGKPNAARAVGGACSANPVPVFVPCHRVVASGGGLGGFSLGLPLKRRLLALESQ